MNNKILGDKKKSNFDDNLADYVNQLAEKGELNKNLIPAAISKVIFELNIDPAMWSYNESLIDLREGRFREKYTRHPRPREVFDYLRRNSMETCIKKGFFNSNPEWTSCAFRKEGDKLFVALDPENIFWDKEKTTYTIERPGILCSEIKEFDIGNKSLNKWIVLEEFPKELINYLYGSIKSYAEILGVYSPKFMFLKEEIWLPVGRCKYSLFQDYFAQSRGVKIEK